MPTDAILLVTTGVIAVAVILPVLLAHNVANAIKISFTAILLNLLLWQVTIFVADTSTTNLGFWNHLVFFWPTLGVFGFFLFVKLLRSYATQQDVNVAQDKTPLAIVVAATFLQLVAIFSGDIFRNVSYSYSDNAYFFERGDFYPVYVVGLVVVLVTALYSLISSFYRSAPGSQARLALKMVVVTVCFAVAFGLTTNVAVPLLTASQDYISLGLFTVDILAIGFALSIFKYQFLDIKVYVFRAVTYLLSILFIGLMYALIVGIVTFNLLNIEATQSIIVITALAALVVGVSFEPLRRWFNRHTNSIFYRDYYDPQEVLDDLATILVGSVDRSTIQEKSISLLKTSLHSTFISFIVDRKNSNDLKDADLVEQLMQSGKNVINPYGNVNGKHAQLIKQLKEKEVALAIRLRTKQEDIGFLLLGFRRSGNGYSVMDKRFLSLVADQLALGLQNALRFEEIQMFNETLQHKIDDATKQLQYQNKRLKELDQTKDDFISMASHQLRTPLTAVKGYTSMVLEGDAGKVSALQKRLLMQSFMSAQRMVYLIADLLNVSRLRTGKFELELAPTNLGKVVSDEIKQLKDGAKARNLELTFEQPEDFPTYMLDDTKLRQVIMNFIDNAIYYTPTGGNIAVKLANNPDSIELTVTDTGIGVPKRDQPHMFTKYFRAHNAQVARPDGTGLGLFMAKKIIIAHGGAIIFRSREHRGSTFGFSFPKSALHEPPKVSKTEVKTDHNPAQHQ